MEFKVAKLDRTATIVSIVTTVFLTVLSIFFVVKVPLGWLFAIFMMFIPLCCYLLSPKKIIFKGSTLIIEKVVGRQIIIPMSDIEAYIRVPNFAKLKVARTFGNGGLFGFYGLFSTAEYGEMNCQLTNLKDIIIIKTQKMNFALSPQTINEFEQYLKTNVTGIAGEIKILEPLPEDEKNRANPAILIVPIVLFILIIIMVLQNYAQLAERIAVHFDIYGNPDKWGHKSSYLLSGLVPSTIMFLLTISIFFIMRKRTSRPAIPNFLVLIMSFILLFIAYTSLATFWFNKYNKQLIPMHYGIIIFVVLMIVLLFIYYRKIVKR